MTNINAELTSEYGLDHKYNDKPLQFNPIDGKTEER